MDYVEETMGVDQAFKNNEAEEESKFNAEVLEQMIDEMEQD